VAFHNVVFPEDYSQGAVGGPEFRTTVVSTGSGFEQRNVDWATARCRWDLSRLLYDPATRDATIAFFRARKGRAHSFLFKDWADYFVGMAWNAATRTLNHTGAHNFAIGNGIQTVFELVRVYDSGGFTEARRITRPRNPIRVYLNGALQATGFTVDYNAGRITFTVPPGNGIAVGWSGEFFVPVRFDTDVLSMEYVSPTVGDAQLPVVEVRE